MASFLRAPAARGLFSLGSTRLGLGRCLAATALNHHGWRAMSKDTGNGAVRIGCASAFWGDTTVSAPQLIYEANIDFLVFDYLSEITMSLLTAAKKRAPELGYAPDFVEAGIGPYVKDIKSKGIRVVSNAGGVNPQGCAAALQAACRKQDVDLKIAVVCGDDLSGVEREKFASVKDMDSGASLPRAVHSVNAYLGAGPICRALEAGADIVVTGRCVDSALVLAPLVHQFNWSWDQYDQLAAGSLAGHLLECGAQSTGGIFTDWHLSLQWDRIGFPIAECGPNGDLVITKPAGTGGLVTVPTVGEQLLYEIGDPRSYLLPDVTCDFSQVRLDQAGEDRVRVSGARGRPPSNKYKVCATYLDGFRAMAVCPVMGPEADVKAHRTAQAILTRCRSLFSRLGLSDFDRVHVQVLGAGESYPPEVRDRFWPGGVGSCREAVLWLAVHHPVKRALDIFSREVAPAGTGMAPGLTNIIGGRPKPSPVLRLFSFLYPKKEVPAEIHMNGNLVDRYEAPVPAESKDPSAVEDQTEPDPVSGQHTYRLRQLAYSRSGDKGDTCNIGVLARSPAVYPHLVHALTPERVAEYFSHLMDSPADGLPPVERYLLPGVHGMNFVLRRSLGGGGVASLRPDPQGKAYGQMLLDMELTNLPQLSVE